MGAVTRGHMQRHGDVREQCQWNLRGHAGDQPMPVEWCTSGCMMMDVTGDMSSAWSSFTPCGLDACHCFVSESVCQAIVIYAGTLYIRRYSVVVAVATTSMWALLWWVASHPYCQCCIGASDIGEDLHIDWVATHICDPRC